MSKDAEQFAAAVFVLLGATLIFFVVFLAAALGIMLSWNSFAPSALDLANLNYRQSLGLTGLLFIAKAIPATVVTKRD